MDVLKKPRVVVAVAVGLLLSWSGCGDMLMPPPFGPDAGSPDPMIDAGLPIEPDATPPDAAPPWEPTDPIYADDPCEIVSDGPEVEYDSAMANYSVRFRDGQGLELSGDIRQAGLLEVENADLEKRDAVEKRLGADVLADTRTTTPGDVVPDADRRAIWARGDETLLQTHDSIYSRQVATDAFAWRRVGSWTQTRLREAYGNTFDAEVQSADYAPLGDADLVAYELVGGDGVLAIYGPSGALEATQAITGSTRPRLSGEDDQLRVSYVDAARALQSGPYTTGASSVTFAPVGLTLAAGRLFWDVTGVRLDTGPHVSGWVGTPTNSTSEIRLAWDGATPGNASRVLPLPGGDAPVTDDCAITVFPVTNVDGSIRVAVAQVYLANATLRHRLYVEMLNVNLATGAITLVDSDNANLGAHPNNFARAVAISWEDFATVWVAVEQDSGVGGTPDNQRKVSYYRFVNGNVLTPGTVHNATALATQGAILVGTPTLALPASDPLTPVFGEVLLGGLMTPPALDDLSLARNGWIMFAPRTREVIARSMVGYTGNLSSKWNGAVVRPAKGSLIAGGDDVAWGGPVSVQAEPAGPLVSIAKCRMDRAQYANEPSFADMTSVAAHAGYPRAYDGVNVFEHDWHSLPRITTSVTTSAGAGFSAGTYTAALQWEWDDANGTRYRSAPAFSRPFVAAGAFSAFNIDTEILSHTERSNVRAVIWLTPANGTTLHRITDVAVTFAAASALSFDAFFTNIPNFTGVPTEYATADALILAQEQLDQAPTPLGLGIVSSDRARVTDFVARAGDRLFSRDPLAGKLARFSIPSREASGFSMHWPLAFAVEEPDEREVTAVLEMDGRIVIGSELGLALLTADGPDATGADSFGIPTILRAEIGIADQPQLARTPIGYAFGTRNGEPKLLTPGLTVDDLAKQVERAYKIDGTNIVSIAYDQNREEMVFLANSGKTLRLNTSTGRWASDPNRLGRDLTVTKDGTLYVIRHDGKVLKQREDVWADGGIGYALKVSTPWIRDMARDGTTHSSFRLGAVYVSGEYLGPHDLFFDVYKDFNDVTPWGTFQVPEATVVANAAANRGWIYGVRLGGRDSFLAARIVVRDGAEPNRTFRLAQMDIDIETNGSSKYVELPQTHYAAVV